MKPNNRRPAAVKPKPPKKEKATSSLPKNLRPSNGGSKPNKPNNSRQIPNRPKSNRVHKTNRNNLNGKSRTTTSRPTTVRRNNLRNRNNVNNKATQLATPATPGRNAGARFRSQNRRGNNNSPNFRNKNKELVDKNIPTPVKTNSERPRPSGIPKASNSQIRNQKRPIVNPDVQNNNVSKKSLPKPKSINRNRNGKNKLKKINKIETVSNSAQPRNRANGSQNNSVRNSNQRNRSNTRQNLNQNNRAGSNRNTPQQLKPKTRQNLQEKNITGVQSIKNTNNAQRHNWDAHKKNTEKLLNESKQKKALKAQLFAGESPDIPSMFQTPHGITIITDRPNVLGSHSSGRILGKVAIANHQRSLDRKNNQFPLVNNVNRAKSLTAIESRASRVFASNEPRRIPNNFDSSARISSPSLLGQPVSLKNKSAKDGVFGYSSTSSFILPTSMGDPSGQTFTVNTGAARSSFTIYV